MDLPDINVLIYAHREDAAEHDAFATWLKKLVSSSSPYALSSFTLGGFLRIVTNRRIFNPATPMNVAMAFCRQLASQPRAVLVQPGSRHWDIMTEIIEAAGIEGAMVSDVYLAALAIEHGCELVTTDANFARFPDLRWRHPLAPSP